MSTSPIAAMFDRISPKYDALNHLLSLNIDKVWRKKTAKAVAKSQPKTILDLATGTADLALALAKCNPQAHIIGMDISEKMLNIGKAKAQLRGFGQRPFGNQPCPEAGRASCHLGVFDAGKVPREATLPILFQAFAALHRENRFKG